MLYQWTHRWISPALLRKLLGPRQNPNLPRYKNHIDMIHFSLQHFHGHNRNLQMIPPSTDFPHPKSQKKKMFSWFCCGNVDSTVPHDTTTTYNNSTTSGSSSKNTKDTSPSTPPASLPDSNPRRKNELTR